MGSGEKRDLPPHSDSLPPNPAPRSPERGARPATAAKSEADRDREPLTAVPAPRGALSLPSPSPPGPARRGWGAPRARRVLGSPGDAAGVSWPDLLPTRSFQAGKPERELALPRRRDAGAKARAAASASAAALSPGLEGGRARRAALRSLSRPPLGLSAPSPLPQIRMILGKDPPLPADALSAALPPPMSSRFPLARRL